MRKVNYTRHIGFIISEKTYQQLVKITDEKEMPFSQFIRDVLCPILRSHFTTPAFYPKNNYRHPA